MSLTRVFGLPRRLLSLRCLLRGAQVSSVGMLLIAASACSKQGEGERCDLANFDEDCESGLVCTDLSTKRSNAQGAVCCAPDSTVDVCLDDKFSFEDDAGAESSGPASSSDDTSAPSNSSSVVPTDAGPDAASSAPETSSSSEPNQTVVDAGASSSSSSDAASSSAEPSSAPDAALPDAG